MERIRRLRAPLAVLVLALAVTGCGNASPHRSSSAQTVRPSQNTSSATQQQRVSPAKSQAKVAEVGCGDWIGTGTTLRNATEKQYGELLDCAGIGGVWVLTTEPRQAASGVVGVHVCSPTCAADIPASLSDWSFYDLGMPAGSFSRLAAVNADGTILFTGGAGEVAFDPATGRFSQEAEH